MSSVRRLVLKKPFGIFAVLWPFVFLAPLIPGIPKSWTGFAWRQELVIGALLLLTLVHLIRRTDLLRTSSISFQKSELTLLVPLALFLLWSVASVVWSGDWSHTLHYNLTWAAYLTCFIVMRQAAKSPRLLSASLGSLAFIILIISVASAIEFWSTSPELYQQSLLLRRSTGLGEPLAVALPMFAILAITLRNRGAVALCGATTVLAWLAVLQTLERAPLLALGASLVLMTVGLFVNKSWRPRRPRQAMALVALLIASTVFQTVGTSSSFHRLRDLEEKDPNTQIRLLVWAIGVEMVRAHPITGVGANNFEIAYPSSRAAYSARQPNSPLVPLQEEFLAQRTHNEYLQILAELGVVGFAFFVIFCCGLMWLAVKALRSASNPLALGAVCSLATFAVSSGASSVSFRWFSSGLLFFFAAAIVTQFAGARTKQSPGFTVSPFLARFATASGLVFATAFVAVMSLQGTNAILRAFAVNQTTTLPAQSDDSNKVEKLFRAALSSNPYDGATHFDFGGWLDAKRRYNEAAQHLSFATEHGFNSSTCYAYLARAQAAAGDTVAAEQTLAKAVRIYPRSVFLRVRHSIALAEIGKAAEASQEYELALATNKPAARGWRHLMCFGADEAYAASNNDSGISPPRKLEPQAWAYPASAEQALRPPTAYPTDEDWDKTF
jgi:O-antigen ligase